MPFEGRKIKVVAFDADDTLWINLPYFLETERKFCNLLSRFGDQEYIQKFLFEIEMANLKTYGYGAKAFTLSLLECAFKLNSNNPKLSSLSVKETENILNLGTVLLNMPIELIEGVEDVLKALSGKYTLVLATKGDLIEQENKLKNSRIENYFDHIEIMSRKTEDEYLNLINRLNIKQEEFLMVGNSLKSDIIPVINIGGHGVHIPFHTTWLHEKVDEEVCHPNLHCANKVEELINILNNL